MHIRYVYENQILLPIVPVRTFDTDENSDLDLWM